jgi:hypothetical protein
MIQVRCARTSLKKGKQRFCGKTVRQPVRSRSAGAAEKVLSAGENLRLSNTLLLSGDDLPIDITG